MLIDADFVPKLASKARLKHDRHENQYVLLYPERGLVLNDSAAAIAQRCDGTRSIGAIIGELAEAHPEAPRAAIERDVLDFVSGLLDKALLERPR